MDITWQNDLLATADISQSRFAQLPDQHKLFILTNKHIFYSLNGAPILNLLHPKYAKMAKMLRLPNAHKGA